MNWGEVGDRIQPINFFLPSELHYKKSFYCCLTGYGPSPEVSEMKERILFCHINEKAQKKFALLFNRFKQNNFVDNIICYMPLKQQHEE